MPENNRNLPSHTPNKAFLVATEVAASEDSRCQGVDGFVYAIRVILSSSSRDRVAPFRVDLIHRIINSIESKFHMAVGVDTG